MTKNLFIFSGIVGLLFGLPFIFSPDVLIKAFTGESSVAAGAGAALRDYGIMLSTAGIALFIARDSVSSSAKKAMLLFVIMGAVLIAANSVYSVLSGIGNSKVWGIVIVCIIQALWGIVALGREK
jgi:hypothetical protein